MDIKAPYEIINSVLHYRWDLCVAWLEATGKKKFGKHFRIYKKDHAAIYKLVIYCIRDKEEAERLGLNLQKGILLSGPVGCGKTSLMKLFGEFPGTSTFEVRSTRQIAVAFMKKGFPVISSYGQKSEVICFDDLGTEQSLKYFGNETNVMAEILLERYDLFSSRNIKTHGTTNLSASELESIYGNRIRSRMRESFNLVTMTGPDKRG